MEKNRDSASSISRTDIYATLLAKGYTLEELNALIESRKKLFQTQVRTLPENKIIAACAMGAAVGIISSVIVAVVLNLTTTLLVLGLAGITAIGLTGAGAGAIIGAISATFFGAKRHSPLDILKTKIQTTKITKRSNEKTRMPFRRLELYS